MSIKIQCWHCGNTLTVMLPLSRREVCDHCNADQHACRLCKHYDPTIADQCREERAESVTDKDKANFCDYFSANPQAYQNTGSQQSQAKAKLDALFGDETESSSENSTPQSKAEAAKKALDDLFK